MRVPIYPIDLLAKHGFKQIAKKLQRNWPGPTSIGFLKAQEILSKGLGYCDYHDVLRSFEKCEPDEPVPTETQVRDGIYTSIFGLLQSGLVGTIDESEINRLVTLLPLHELSVFDDASQRQTADQNQPDTLQPSMESQLERSVTIQDKASRQKSPSAALNSNSKPYVTHVRLLSQSELLSIGKAVQRTDSLRDECLYALMITGIRANVLRLIKVNDLAYVHTDVRLRLHVNKSGIQKRGVFLYTTAGVVARYIEASGLSEGD
ncbi:MAG: hypothetical protein ACOH2R_18490 [Pseudomonas sp.]